MAEAERSAFEPGPPPSTSSWTYPTRTCRLCLEEVAATVTLYPPGLPMALQHPVVEYLSDNEYGRLCKPCKCKGGMRYIHELCLRRCRTESQRPGAMWKCDLCGYEFNFARLTMQRYLGSKKVSGLLTILFMLAVMFVLGFVADPILNLYTDPYETIIGHEDLWQRVQVNQAKDKLGSWGQHFVKGLVSMGVLSFLRTMLLNPFHWFNLRNSGLVGGRASGRATTGRDRAVNVSWLMIAIGVVTAFYLFYQWVQIIIGRYLQRLGNNIVDTQLPDDDEDLKPPSNFKFEESYPELAAKFSNPDQTSPGDPVPSAEAVSSEKVFDGSPSSNLQTDAEEVSAEPKITHRQGFRQEIPITEDSSIPGQLSAEDALPVSYPSSTGHSSSVQAAHSQGWSFDHL